MKNDNLLLNNAVWHVDFAFDEHPQLFERLAEFDPLKQDLKQAIHALGASVGILVSDHSCWKNPASKSLDHLRDVERMLANFHDLVPDKEKSGAYFAAKHEVERRLGEARKALAR